MKVLDLFSGMGGLASGFKAAGFQVTGVDRSELAGQTFELNGFGRFVQKDLLMENMTGNYEILIGGPPCRPWSSVNTIKREKRHLDYRLLGVYFKHVLALRPRPLASARRTFRHVRILEQKSRAGRLFHSEDQHQVQ